MNARRLLSENRAYRGTGGISQENRSAGFVPAFLDAETGLIYRSCFADGRPAPIHLLEGLPAHLLCRTSETGQLVAANATLVSGFLQRGKFLTRDEAAAASQTKSDQRS